MFYTSSAEKRNSKNTITIMKYLFSEKLGLAVIEPSIFYDFRGEYVETWNKQNYEVFAELMDVEFVQDDISTSVKHTLRGLHGDFETHKLISCVYGSLFVAVVDMRPDHPTYLTWETFSLNDRNRKQVLVPPGFANGHLVMSESAIFSYKQSTYYQGAHRQFTVKWNDPKVGIEWPIDNPILSSRDKNVKILAER